MGCHHSTLGDKACHPSGNWILGLVAASTSPGLLRQAALGLSSSSVKRDNIPSQLNYCLVSEPFGFQVQSPSCRAERSSTAVGRQILGLNAELCDTLINLSGLQSPCP